MISILLESLNTGDTFYPDGILKTSWKRGTDKFNLTKEDSSKKKSLFRPRRKELKIKKLKPATIRGRSKTGSEPNDVVPCVEKKNNKLKRLSISLGKQVDRSKSFGENYFSIIANELDISKKPERFLSETLPQINRENSIENINIEETKNDFNEIAEHSEETDNSYDESYHEDEEEEDELILEENNITEIIEKKKKK